MIGNQVIGYQVIGALEDDVCDRLGYRRVITRLQIRSRYPSYVDYQLRQTRSPRDQYQVIGDQVIGALEDDVCDA